MERALLSALLAVPLCLPSMAFARQTEPQYTAAATAAALSGVDPVATAADRAAGKPRVFVLTDIGNEPDDQMSLVRLLVYANDLDIEGLVATTSTWQRERVQPQTIRALVAAYGEARPNLMLHARGWPEVAALNAAIAEGPARYGMAGISAPGPLSSGARKLIEAVDRADPRPLHISVWGGANTLAEALREVKASRSPEALAAFVGKIQVLSISDQDDAGPWIRREFPKLNYVVKPSPPDGEEYASATWTGISGDRFYRNADGADFSTVTNEWLDANVRKGPLGAHYPKFMYIMEGDTPSFLGLLPNGLESWRSPSWGGWGGRYVYRQPYGETHKIWSQGGDMSARVTSADRVTGVDGRTYITDQATIWRWREAYQHDFAARMGWSYLPAGQGNHPPVAAIAGQSDGVIEIAAKAGAPLVLDASSSKDPDGGKLTYRWFHYAEAGQTTGSLGAVKIDGAQSARATITPTATCRPQWLQEMGQPPSACPAEGLAHVILAVTDDGAPSLTRYRRIVLRITR